MEQSKKSAITRKKILDAAEKEFADLGFGAARINSIAENAEVNKQLIYSHFVNKNGLYTAVLKNVYSRLSLYEEKLSGMEFESIKTAKAIILEYFHFLISNPSFVKIVLWENLDGAKHIASIDTTLFTGVKNLLEKGIAKGIIRKDLDMEQTVLSFNMFCFSAFSNVNTVSKLMHKNLASTEELNKRAEHIADILATYIQVKTAE